MHFFFSQSQRLKQRTDKHMKEKYAHYYKKLKYFQDPVENPDNEGEYRICDLGTDLKQGNHSMQVKV